MTTPVSVPGATTLGILLDAAGKIEVQPRLQCVREAGCRRGRGVGEHVLEHRLGHGLLGRLYNFGELVYPASLASKLQFIGNGDAQNLPPGSIPLTSGMEWAAPEPSMWAMSVAAGLVAWCGLGGARDAPATDAATDQGRARGWWHGLPLCHREGDIVSTVLGLHTPPIAMGAFYFGSLREAEFRADVDALGPETPRLVGKQREKSVAPESGGTRMLRVFDVEADLVGGVAGPFCPVEQVVADINALSDTSVRSRGPSRSSGITVNASLRVCADVGAQWQPMLLLPACCGVPGRWRRDRGYAGNGDRFVMSSDGEFGQEPPRDHRPRQISVRRPTSPPLKLVAGPEAVGDLKAEIRKLCSGVRGVVHGSQRCRLKS